MTLDLSSLQKAVSSLERAIKVASSQITGEVDTDYEEVIRAGVIQSFEFTYEVCWKFMKRWLENNFGNDTVDGLSKKELFRVAAESQLIKDVEVWIGYHEARNKTSHIYDEDKAKDVYDAAVQFINEAKDLLEVLKAKND
ncbi:MAG: nucleotidyltransferase substrate binding protein [bacterium]|nr:nucleotidyltransferase substrate binding protein [bacterium]